MSQTAYTLTIIMSFTEAKKDLKKVFDGLRKQKITASKDLQIIFFDETGNEKLKNKVQKYGEGFGIEMCNSADAVKNSIQGSYVNFCNGKDAWTEGSLDKICNFLKNHQEIGCAVSSYITIKGEEKHVTPTPDMIYDIADEPFHVKEDLKRFVFRREYLNCIPHLNFEQSEEALLLGLRAIVKSGLVAMMPTALLRVADEAATRIEDLEQLMSKCQETSIEACGSVVPYAEHQMFSLVYQYICNNRDKELVYRCLQNISDGVIASSFPINGKGRLFEERIYAYLLKHRDEKPELILNEQGQFVVDGEILLDVSEHGIYNVAIMTVDSDNKKLILEGSVRTTYVDSDAEHFIRDEKGELYPLEVHPFKHDDLLGCNGELVNAGQRFYVEIPLHFGMNLEFVMKYSRTGKLFTAKFSKGNFVKLHPNYIHAYYVKKPYIIQMEGNALTVEKNTAIKHFGKELTYMHELLKNYQGAKVCFRLAYWFCKAFGSRKPIWIINDRPHNAGDNGEALFKYLMNSPLKKTHRIYFMLSKKSPDYERLSKIGPVLDYYSYKHKLNFLMSDKIISSIGNELPTNPFGKSRKLYYDLYKADFVYLRHGVSHNDQSGWLNKFKRNYAMINSSAKPEYESLMTGNYLYSDKQAVLCGLPRFDNLKSENKNKIAFLPTWRKSLQGQKLENSEKRLYSDDFTQSEFYQFYNTLINDERLHRVMEKHNFTGDFYLHPVMSAQTDDFGANKYIKVHSEVADYQKVFRESNIMVTDYSSVAFDFAYLKKPVIYAQFDFDKFYEEHSWDKGYFSYDRDALGMVTRDYETTLNAIINYIETGCNMEQEYIDKVDKFFAYTDRNNCERIVKAILELDKK